jgi:hypothetical protein
MLLQDLRDIRERAGVQNGKENENMKIIGVSLIASALVALGGCVAVPAGPGYYEAAPAYYAPAPAYYAPSVYFGPSIGFGAYRGGRGYGRGGGRGHH